MPSPEEVATRPALGRREARRAAVVQAIADRVRARSLPATAFDIDAVTMALKNLTGAQELPTDPSERAVIAWQVAIATDRSPELVEAILNEVTACDLAGLGSRLTGVRHGARSAHRSPPCRRASAWRISSLGITTSAGIW